MVFQQEALLEHHITSAALANLCQGAAGGLGPDLVVLLSPSDERALFSV